MKPLSLWLARRLVKLPHFTLVNLLAGEELFPEIATSRDESERIAGHVLGWLNGRDGATADGGPGGGTAGSGGGAGSVRPRRGLPVERAPGTGPRRESRQSDSAGAWFTPPSRTA